MAATQGFYSKNSQEYYNDAYFTAIMNGKSPRKARKIAEALAGQYQADRVRFLDGLLNSYGRDGLITNEYGNQIIGALADENPNLASFYAQIYPNAKDAFARQNALEDKVIDQNNALQLLSEGGAVTGLNQDNAAKHNLKPADFNFKNTLTRDAQQQKYKEKNDYNQFRFSYWPARNQGEINKEAARLQADLTLWNHEYPARLGVDLEDKKFWQNVARTSKLADYFGYTDDGKKSFMEAVLFGIKPADSKTGKFDDKSIESAKKVHDSLDKRADSILKQLKDGALDLSEDEINALNAQLADIRQFQEQLENVMGKKVGVEAPKSRQDIPNFTGKEEQDIQTLREMLRYMDEQNLSDEDKNYYVRQWLPKDRTDRYADYLIKKARGS